MGLIKTIKDRWCAETPKFFRKLKKLAVTLGSSATAIWMINTSMGLGLEQIVLDICKYVIAGSAAMGLTAQLTQVDNQQNINNNQ